LSWLDVAALAYAVSSRFQEDGDVGRADLAMPEDRRCRANESRSLQGAHCRRRGTVELDTNAREDLANIPRPFAPPAAAQSL
jgi:hypothetical protein